ncbi:glycosyltransferase family 2 protein [Monashia sp. NPDC004114]
MFDQSRGLDGGVDESPVPEISVVIPCYNCAHVLPLQLEALATQTQAPPFEVIVVDNRSTDGLGRVVDGWRARLPTLRLVEARALQGASYARNVGIGAARARRLMFCDADDVVSKWWLHHGRLNFEVADLWSGSCIALDGHAFPTSVSAARAAIGDAAPWAPPADDQPGAFPVLMGGNFGASRDVLDAVVGFDQSLPNAGEDNDFAFRARRSGYPVHLSSSTRVAYRQRTDRRAQLGLVYHGAVAHALTASRYDAWDASPQPPWLEGLMRVAVAGVLMCVVSRRRDWAALAERACSAVGIAHGVLRYGRGRRLPPPLIGRGVDDRVA